MARYIDADKLYVNVKADCNPYGKPTINFDDGCKVLDMIMGTPTADVAPVVHAHWRYMHRSKRFGLYVGACSHCGSPNIVADYCGTCGAKMDEEVK